MHRGRVAIALACVALGVGSGGGLTTSTVHAQAETDGLIRVVHGLRGVVADVYLDGTLVLPTFRPERSTDPLPIPAGDHLVEIRAAGAAATDTPLLTQTVTVPAGFRGSMVAHLDASGQPKLSVFADDTTAVPPGSSRLVVRHAAAAGNVNVLLNAQATLTGLAADKEATQVVTAGTYEIQVTAPEGGPPLAPPQDVEYPDGTANFMYLIGSQADDTLGWAAVQVADLETAPEAIQTGDGSTEIQALDQGRDFRLLTALALAILVGISAVHWSRTRRARG